MPTVWFAWLLRPIFTNAAVFLTTNVRVAVAAANTALPACVAMSVTLPATPVSVTVFPETVTTPPVLTT